MRRISLMDPCAAVLEKRLDHIKSLFRSQLAGYPTLAKADRVSGTVVLHATISKSRAIKDLQVVSGSPMPQQPAVDAARTRRHKPYKLSNEPVEVEMTINVVFTLAK